MSQKIIMASLSKLSWAILMPPWNRRRSYGPWYLLLYPAQHMSYLWLLKRVSCCGCVFRNPLLTPGLCPADPTHWPVSSVHSLCLDAAGVWGAPIGCCRCSCWCNCHGNIDVPIIAELSPVLPVPFESHYWQCIGTALCSISIVLATGVVGLRMYLMYPIHRTAVSEMILQWKPLTAVMIKQSR